MKRRYERTWSQVAGRFGTLRNYTRLVTGMSLRAGDAIWVVNHEAGVRARIAGVVAQGLKVPIDEQLHNGAGLWLTDGSCIDDALEHLVPPSGVMGV